MKAAVTAAALLAASAASTLADPIFARAAVPEEELAFGTQAARVANCDLTDTLCPACDATNVTSAAGISYAVSCGWEYETATEVEVEGDTSTKICLEACEEADGCAGVNIASDGSCTIATGETQGLRRVPGITNLLRLPTSPVKPTSAASAPTTKASSGGAAPTNTNAKCDLSLNNLCPACNGREVESQDGRKYTLLCDSDLSSNDTYSPQEWMSPGECLATCDGLGFCKATLYYDDRNCEIAKDGDFRPISKAGYTAFLPVSTKTASFAVISLTLPTRSPSGKPTKSKPVITVTLPSGTSSAKPTHPRPAGYDTTSVASPPEATFSILPIGSGCNSNALSCPQCDGLPYLDQLNGSYTVACGVEPTCMSTVEFADGAEDVEDCLQKCDQDVTCIAAMWYPEYKECHGCQQGMPKTTKKKYLPYILLAADVDGQDDNTATQTLEQATSIKTSTSLPISDYPAPFPTVTSVDSVKPILASSTQEPASEVTSAILAPTSASGAIRLTTSSIPAQVTNIGELICPGANNEVYVEPSSGNYFTVNCGNIFSAAHSSYTSASDLAGCVAACTGDCDGVQFGYSTRCGLYTDISVVQSATGWTVAASITHPTSGATASVAAIVSSPSVLSTSAAWVPYGNVTLRH
ncbi:hypothetical protein DOTSEDRAFT_72347 [Dothistroma septosporum NZE10]|uniref:PAN-3 domain-containing protein n=1 Tax=Dothistroma septosporum (strain NZE10 / CBS 128990) TaxID=675120 RepID=M2XK65_DOTSN|nr:hypothetical protein DOTSEDRAFT_72347 [Dothistroma septosporum NZE10]